MNQQLNPMWLIIPVAALLLIGTISSVSIARQIEETTLTITGKERITKMSGTSDGGTSSSISNYVYTDSEIYVVQDSMWNGHFSAGTVYASIPDGPSICDVRLSGVRFGLLSMYQNIIAADCRAP